MTDRPTGSGRTAGDVLRLDCARFEAALAEDALDARARSHAEACPRCAAMAREMDRLAAAIATATGPQEVPEGFADAVLARADHLAGFPLDAPRRPTRAWLPWAVGGAAAALLLAFWMGGVTERARVDTHPLAVRDAGPAPAATPAPAETPAAEAPAAPAPPVRLVRAPTARPEAPRPLPQVPAAPVIPEPALDLPGSLHGALLRQIDQIEACPAASHGAVRVTVTVQADGTLTNRQILSSGGASEAHHCVGYALDRLLLPPLDEPMTVTLDLSW